MLSTTRQGMASMADSFAGAIPGGLPSMFPGLTAPFPGKRWSCPHRKVPCVEGWSCPQAARLPGCYALRVVRPTQKDAMR
eukprot:1161060-Pelagomonas_calceolata.AAC.18